MAEVSSLRRPSSSTTGHLGAITPPGVSPRPNSAVSSGHCSSTGSSPLTAPDGGFVEPTSGKEKERQTTPRVVMGPPAPSLPLTSMFKLKSQTGKRMSTVRASNRVQVAVRIRPISKYDGADAMEVVRAEPGNSVVVGRHGEKERRFTYDHVFVESQAGVYESLGRPMLMDAFEGYNVCLFAYGQTGSGKTYSIQGDGGDEGIVPRFCAEMFGLAQEKLEEDATLTIKISMSFIEIYNEKVRDLLEKKRKGQPELTALELHENPETRKVYVDSLSIHTVINYDRIKKLLEQGNEQRQVAETKMNEASSRSHSIIQFYLSQTHDPPTPEKRDIESVVTMVDLAGSERQSKTESTGLQFDESKNINRSLLMLGRALNSFSDGKTSHVPLRESKLTRLLSECFGGNARTWMLACVSPSSFNHSETMSTLEYAQSAKAIINKAKVNSIQQRLELKELREQHDKLTELYDDEKERSRQLQLELQGRAELILELKAENEALRKQLQDLEVTKLQIADALDTARGEVSELRRANQEIKTTPLRYRDGVQMYIGRAKVSLKNIIEQTSNYLTLPLVSDMAVDPTTSQPQLIVNIYPVDSKGCSTLDNIRARGGVKDLLGQRVDFVVHIICAKGIPKGFSHSVYCKYVYKWAEKDSYKTAEVKESADPEFDFKKRFAFSKMNQGLVDYFMSDNVITFEVIGESKPPS